MAQHFTISTKPRKVNVWRAIGWGVTDCMGGGSGTVIGAYFMFFLTTFVGLDALKASSIIAISRMLDMVTNVVVGSASDHMHHTKLGRRFGRRRIFLLLGVPLMLIFALLWIPGRSYWYYLVVFILFDISDSVVMVPYETLPSEMTDDYKERTLMSTTRMFFSGASGYIATIVSGLLLSWLGSNNPYAYTVLGACLAVFYAACVLTTFLTTWERPYTPEMLEEIAASKRYRAAKRRSLRRIALELWSEVKDYLSTLRVRSFRQHLAIYLFGVTGQDVFSQIFMYFVVFDLLRTSAFASSLLSVGIIGLPLTFLWGALFVKIGPSKLYTLSFTLVLITVGGYYSLFMTHATGQVFIIAAYAISVVFQTFKSIIYFVPWNVFPFIPDVDEIITGKRREGRFAGMMNFSRKATSSLAGIAVGYLLTRYGFQSDAHTQTPAVQLSIANIMLFGVCSLTLIALVIALRFSLNRDTHKTLVDEVARLRAGGAPEAVDPRVRGVVESLTGVKYGKLHHFIAEPATTAHALKGTPAELDDEETISDAPRQDEPPIALQAA